MAKYRRDRINDAVFKECAALLRTLRDPRIQNNFVSITRAEVAPDLRNAKIFFSTMQEEKEVKEALTRAAGFFRRHLAVTLNLRVTPELLFVSDHSIEYGAHISRLLHDIEKEREAFAAEVAGAGNTANVKGATGAIAATGTADAADAGESEA